MANISFYGSHNSAVVVEEGGKILTVIEIERFLSRKNAGYAQYLISNTRTYLLTEILRWIKENFGISEYENCFFLNCDTIEHFGKVEYERMIPAKNYINSLHHLSHAASGLYQSSFDEALIVSFDGGGNDGFFNVYHVPNRETINEVVRLPIDLGFAYMSFGEFLSDIKLENDLSIGNLVYSGKIMGLCSYGNLRKEWLDPVKNYYRSKPDGLNYLSLLQILSQEIGLHFSRFDRLSGQDSWDLAKTSQIAFEELFLETMSPYFDQYPNIPLIIVGGCGLNILLNTRLKETLNRVVFIPPNPNDCGIASGLMLNHLKPKDPCDLTYAGIPILDKNCLMMYLENFPFVTADINMISNELYSGKIIGVARGNCEHGPRSLGNRSILCDPTNPNMKDILNAKVKNREWYRPFAPVVRLEDVSKYFEFSGESRWMEFCPKVKVEYREILKSITHVDGTARVQTVTKEQNEWIYDLLTAFEKVSGVGVLLNTSFNVDGKPILSTYQDAINVYHSTQMDGLIIENYYLRK